MLVCTLRVVGLVLYNTQVKVINPLIFVAAGAAAKRSGAHLRYSITTSIHRLEDNIPVRFHNLFTAFLEDVIDCLLH